VSEDLATLADFLPTEGWLGSWMKEMGDVISAPKEFILAAGLASLSATVGRQLWFGLGKRKWYPHLWLMLLAPAGVRKSTAVNASIEAVRWARGTEALLPSRWSPEGFYEALKDCPDGFWDVGEIAGFLRSAGRDYMAGARQELCDVWDSKRIYRRLKKKGDSTEVDFPAPTAIASGRLTDFADAAGLTDFRSGFFSRWLIVTTKVSGEQFYRGMLESDAVDESKADTLFQDLYEMHVELRKTDRKAVFTVEAMMLWEEHDRRWQFEETVEEMGGFGLRRGIQAAKLAVLHSLGTNFTPRVIVEPADVAWGLAVADACFEGVRAIQMDEIGLSQRAMDRDRVWRKVSDMAGREPGAAVTLRAVQRKLWRDFDDAGRLAKQVDMWAQAGMIERGWLKPERGPGAEAIRLLTGRQRPDNWWEINPNRPEETRPQTRPQTPQQPVHTSSDSGGQSE
jgi:hypothetical protein